MAATAGAEADMRNVIDRVQAKLAEAQSPAEAKAALAPAIEMLAHPERRDRPALLGAIATLDRKAWDGLLAWMQDDKLRCRAAAAAALAGAVQGEPPAFDPFAPPDVREQQVAAWRQWVQAAAS
jgi:hypothetical protein